MTDALRYIVRLHHGRAEAGRWLAGEGAPRASVFLSMDAAVAAAESYLREHPEQGLQFYVRRLDRYHADKRERLKRRHYRR